MLVVRGMLCNWLICLAVWVASAAPSVMGKALAVELLIATFATLGLEHSVTNMFLLPWGVLSGATLSWGDLVIRHLIPVTVGNILGGGLFMAMLLWVAWQDRPGKDQVPSVIHPGMFPQGAGN